MDWTCITRGRYVRSASDVQPASVSVSRLRYEPGPRKCVSSTGFFPSRGFVLRTNQSESTGGNQPVSSVAGAFLPSAKTSGGADAKRLWGLGGLMHVSFTARATRVGRVLPVKGCDTGEPNRPSYKFPEPTQSACGGATTLPPSLGG